MTKALVLGVYNQAGGESASSETKNFALTDSATHFDSKIQGKLKSLVSEFGPNSKGKAKTFYDIHPDYPVVSVVGLGPSNAGYNEQEEIDEKRENVRASIAVAAKSVRNEQGVDEVHLDPCGDAEAVAEGANLALWYFDELKSEKYKKKVIKVDLYQPTEDAKVREAFERGTILSKAQNICRRLTEMPANLMTPTIFCETAKDLLKDLPDVKVIVHDKKWAEDKKMGSFLSVAKGSAEEPKFLEIQYNNNPNSKPFALVGKGVCFDSGGISIKPRAQMEWMRGDMGGAAGVVLTAYALAVLKSKVNIIVLVPLCENMPSGTAYKPGDVVVAMNGKTIQNDNTDCEGRMILADALCYAHEFDPQAILDLATLTGAIEVALGNAATGVFSTCTTLFKGLQEAGVHTGDRMWRMPLFNLYTSHVTNSLLADHNNVSKTVGKAGSCTAAAFLKEFVDCPRWCHLDIGGTSESRNEFPYYGFGMSGRPVRTLFYFLDKFFKPGH